MQCVWICSNVKRRHKIIELNLFNLATGRKIKRLNHIRIKAAKRSFNCFIVDDIDSRWIVR